MIEFDDVHASYEATLPILKGVSFTIRDGEFVAFENGAGKSTTMRLVNGSVLHDRGSRTCTCPTTSAPILRQLRHPRRRVRRVRRHERGGEVHHDAPDERLAETRCRPGAHRRRFHGGAAHERARAARGLLFQNPDRQICCNTVREELLFGFKALGQAGAEADARVDAIIEEFGFDADDDPFLLNRGARQLLALASIVVLAPPVVVLDEPTTGLDFRECEKVMAIIRRIHEQGATVIMVCHDMEVVADYATRCIVMSGGTVVDDAPTFDVLRNRDTLERASLVPPQIVDLSLELARAIPAARRDGRRPRQHGGRDAGRRRRRGSNNPGCRKERVRMSSFLNTCPVPACCIA